jgi:hypothetical protein
MGLEAGAQAPVHDVIVDDVGERRDRGCACGITVSIGQGFEEKRPPYGRRGVNEKTDGGVAPAAVARRRHAAVVDVRD